MRANVVAQLGQAGAAQHGVFTSAQAAKAGASDDALETALRCGVVERVGRGVLRLAHHPATWESRLWAALLEAGDGAVVSHRSAARLHECWAFREASEIEVTVPYGRDNRLSGGRLHRSTWLPSGHVTVVDGFPVTTLARTCFDLAGDPDPELRRTAAGRAFHLRKIERLVNDALARRGLTFTAEAAVLGALAKRGRRGTVLIRSLLKKFGPNYVPTHSDGESLFAELAEAFGLPPYERQVRISGPRGYIGTVDGLFRPWRHVVEIDSTWHDGPLDVADDAARDEALVTAGYEITRVRYWRMVLEGEKVMAELLARLDPGFL